MKCKTCVQICIKNGKTRSGEQRYYCRDCKKSQQLTYTYQACKKSTNRKLISLLKEGCGIRSIARLLIISPSTVINRIKEIADKITEPILYIGKEYEVDELCTYIGNKGDRYWVAYALQKDNRQVIGLSIGKRTNKTLRPLVNKLILSEATKIFTDKLMNYRGLVPKPIHYTKKYSINHIERKNLTLRTHLKRLNRRTICYSKSIIMLIACLKIYFWG